MPRTLLFIFRWLLFALACVYLVRTWNRYESSDGLHWLSEGDLLATHWLLMMVGVVLGMLVNWGIEAWKWRTLVAEVERMSFARAFAATLAGCSVSLVTPNRTGEFVGRALFVRPDNRISAAALTVFGNVAQLLVTLVAGSGGLLLLLSLERPLPPVSPAYAWVIILLLALIGSLGCAALIWWPLLFHRLLERLPFLRRYDRHFTVFDRRSNVHSGRIFALSVLRYVVFVSQFIALLSTFGSGVAVADSVLAVPAVFLLNTLAPTMMLTELGVRAATADLVLSSLSRSPLSVVFASSALWAINVLLPAIIGSVVLLIARIRATNTAA